MANVAASAGRYHGQQRRDIALERRLHERFDGSSRILEQALINPETSPSEHANRRERAVILAEVLEQLPGDYREVVMLRQFEGLSLTEVARRMGRTTDSVQKLWVRAVLEIHQLMGKYEL